LTVGRDKGGVEEPVKNDILVRFRRGGGASFGHLGTERRRSYKAE